MDLRELLRATTEPLVSVQYGERVLTPEDGTLFWIVQGLKKEKKK